jgi:hypothetical protein
MIWDVYKGSRIQIFSHGGWDWNKSGMGIMMNNDRQRPVLYRQRKCVVEVVRMLQRLYVLKCRGGERFALCMKNYCGFSGRAIKHFSSSMGEPRNNIFW